MYGMSVVQINSFNIRITTSKLFLLLGASAKRHAMSQQYKYCATKSGCWCVALSRQWWDDRTESNLGGKGGSGQMSNQINYHGIAAVSIRFIVSNVFQLLQIILLEYALYFYHILIVSDSFQQLHSHICVLKSIEILQFLTMWFAIENMKQ
ncbi:Hypothetical_protein [Hexamita inflata]|uniref:Hypothetical_protein n=1 Tax=Hexamita inflata TaxID=28002 RepID=A0AA86PYD6_9EUKA|nr:Hypothetical protein HINF_LOCUS30114 [Hexamita inflata]